jgi:hypothetical protein
MGENNAGKKAADLSAPGIDESTPAGWETGRHRPAKRSLESVYAFFTSYFVLR